MQDKNNAKTPFVLKEVSRWTTICFQYEKTNPLRPQDYERIFPKGQNELRLKFGRETFFLNFRRWIVDAASGQQSFTEQGVRKSIK